MQASLRARRYRQVNIETSTPGQVLLSLYSAAIRYARAGAESIRAGRVVEKGQELQRVADIVAELVSTLNREVSAELCDRLEQLYFYMQERLAHANALLDAGAADEVADLLETLHGAWIEAINAGQSSPGQPNQE